MMFRPYRRLSQLFFFALMFAIPILNLYEIFSITGTYYAISVGGLGVADPVAILQTMFAAQDLAPPLLISILFPAFLAILLGRVWCGWMCPYHLLSDCAASLRSTFRSRVLGKNEAEPLKVPEPFKANIIRYSFLLIGTILAGAIGIPVLNYVSAPGILSTEAMIFVKEHTVSIEFLFVFTILAIELVLFPRFWCRLFCPTGSFLALFRIPFTLRVRSRNKNGKGKCCKDGRCAPACPMGLVPYSEGGDLLCTNCAVCIDVCRSDNTAGMLHFHGFAQD